MMRQNTPTTFESYETSVVCNDTDHHSADGQWTVELPSEDRSTEASRDWPIVATHSLFGFPMGLRIHDGFALKGRYR